MHLRKVAIVGRAKYLYLAARPVAYTWDGIAMQGITIGLTGAPGEGKTTADVSPRRRTRHEGWRLTPVLGLDMTPAPEGNWIVVEAEHGDQSTARREGNAKHSRRGRAVKTDRPGVDVTPEARISARAETSTR